jgi:N-acetylmuramic acid 6-phosphate etherase
MHPSAAAFLREAHLYRLGELPTEQPHPATTGLAGWSRDDLPRALQVWQAVDRAALAVVAAQADAIAELAQVIDRVRRSGGRIFLCGCGATGRLALALETLAREGALGDWRGDAIAACMAGGDTALLRAIEQFEDRPDYGARQLRDLGFGPGDLLLAITEGGETPFVIGAAQAAAASAANAPWFLFCNPPELLGRIAERSRATLEHPHIRALCLDCGPQALTGSTRLQASTVLMLAAGLALAAAGGLDANGLLAELRAAHAALDWAPLARFSTAESGHYAACGLVLYQTDRYGITVLTDTTERAPTFSLAPFESMHQPAAQASLCYLGLPGTADAAAAWRALLGRDPRALDWDGLPPHVRLAGLLGHDISERAGAWRRQRHPDRPHAVFSITDAPGGVRWDFAGCDQLFTMPAGVFLRHILLKLLLNAHSTLLMGRLGRYEDNLMTWVRASNGKLIDRAARYVAILHRRRTGTELPYARAVEAVFAVRDDLGADEPVVLKALAWLR